MLAETKYQGPLMQSKTHGFPRFSLIGNEMQKVNSNGFWQIWFKRQVPWQILEKSIPQLNFNLESSTCIKIPQPCPVGCAVLRRCCWRQRGLPASPIPAPPPMAAVPIPTVGAKRAPTKALRAFAQPALG